MRALNGRRRVGINTHVRTLNISSFLRLSPRAPQRPEGRWWTTRTMWRKTWPSTRDLKPTGYLQTQAESLRFNLQEQNTGPGATGLACQDPVPNHW